MIKLSVALAVRNEEKSLPACLESVKWADEIVVVVETSQDRTEEVAGKYTDRVFSEAPEPMFHKTKQKAIGRCRGEWILQIDADERLTPELAQEIRSKINADPEFAGFQVPRKSRIFGKWFGHTGWYPDYQVKLFRQGKGRYPCKSLHEQIEITGRLGTLSADLLHEHYTSVSQFIDRMNRYTSDDARYLLEKGENVTWKDAVRFPTDEFLKRFFMLEGYKDGLHGLVLSLLQSLNRVVVFAKIWEEQGFWQYGGDNFLSEVVGQTKVSAHDWRYWLMARTKNPLTKGYLKLRNKLSL